MDDFSLEIQQTNTDACNILSGLRSTLKYNDPEEERYIEVFSHFVQLALAGEMTKDDENFYHFKQAVINDRLTAIHLLKNWLELEEDEQTRTINLMNKYLEKQLNELEKKDLIGFIARWIIKLDYKYKVKPYHGPTVYGYVYGF